MEQHPFRAPDLAALDDRGLIARHRDGDRHARGVLIARYLPLARNLALRYRRTTEPVEDLVQVASVGLVKAVDAWDPDRGATLATYAVPTILGELRRHFRDRTWMVRPPRRLIDLALAVERARDPLRTAIGRQPTADDFAAYLDQSPTAIAEALRAAQARWATSLDTPAFDDPEEPANMRDPLAAPDVEYERLEGSMTFARLTGGLTTQAREILWLRLEADLCQAAIAERIGRSQMHVSRSLRASATRCRNRDAPETPAPRAAPTRPPRRAATTRHRGGRAGRSSGCAAAPCGWPPDAAASPRPRESRGIARGSSGSDPRVVHTTLNRDEGECDRDRRLSGCRRDRTLAGDDCLRP
jgi:RNA polymerase sigma-B factor